MPTRAEGLFWVLTVTLQVPTDETFVGTIAKRIRKHAVESLNLEVRCILFEVDSCSWGVRQPNWKPRPVFHLNSTHQVGSNKWD